MTRVLVVEAAGNMWGSERSLLDLLSAVPDLDVAVCCPPATPLEHELRRRGVRTLPHFVSGLHEKSRWHRVRAALGVLRACLTFRPKVIHLNQSGSYKVVAPAARLFRIPVVAHVRIFEDAAYLARQLNEASGLSGIVAISDAVRDEIRRYPELSGVPVHRLYNAYVGQARSGSVAAAVTTRIACVARLVPIKGHDVLIDALGLLTSAGYDIRCVMIGDGNETFTRTLKACAEALGISDRLEWPGFVEDVAPILAEATVVVCPSHREPLGRAVLDAWSSGALPIVYAGSGGAAEIVRASGGGLIYADQTGVSLAHTLRTALAMTAEARASLSRKGREWMQTNCDPRTYGIAFSEVLRAAADRHRQPRALMLESAGNLWGSERSLLDMLTAVPGLNVAVCCPPRTPLSAELARRGIRTLPYYVEGLHERSRLHRLRAAIGVLRACLVFRPAVVHLNQSGSFKIALPAARLLGIPLVGHVRIYEDVTYLAKQKPSAQVLRGLIAISHAIEAEIRRFDDLRSIPVHRLYDAYVPARGQSKASPSRPHIACVGRLVPIKGHDVLLRALALLRTEGVVVDCLMAGDGRPDFVASLKQLAEDSGLTSSVKWLGFVNDTSEVLGTSRALVCPSHREPLGRVIFEAWDAGAVPIAFAGGGGAAEIIADSGGGLLYESQRPEALAAVLRRALELSAEESARLVANGRRWLADNCEPQRYGRTVSNILSRAMGASASHP